MQFWALDTVRSVEIAVRSVRAGGAGSVLVVIRAVNAVLAGPIAGTVLVAENPSVQLLLIRLPRIDVIPVKVVAFVVVEADTRIESVVSDHLRAFDISVGRPGAVVLLIPALVFVSDLIVAGRVANGAVVCGSGRARVVVEPHARRDVGRISEGVLARAVALVVILSRAEDTVRSVPLAIRLILAAGLVGIGRGLRARVDALNVYPLARLVLADHVLVEVVLLVAVVPIFAVLGADGLFVIGSALIVSAADALAGDFVVGSVINVAAAARAGLFFLDVLLIACAAVVDTRVAYAMVVVSDAFEADTGVFDGGRELLHLWDEGLDHHAADTVGLVFVEAEADLAVAIVAPVRAPRIFDEHVRRVTLDTVSDGEDGVVWLFATVLTGDDSVAIVLLELG